MIEFEQGVFDEPPKLWTIEHHLPMLMITPWAQGIIPSIQNEEKWLIACNVPNYDCYVYAVKDLTMHLIGEDHARV